MKKLEMCCELSAMSRPKTHQFSGRNLLISMMLNFIITVVEIIGGLFAGSLSLLSDALHNFSDAISLIVSYVALKISGKENTAKMTFGYRRSQILASLFNSIILVAVTIFLFREAYDRLIHPSPVNSILMISVAIIGFVVNTLSVLLLKHDSKDNLNIKSAYLHLFTDALSSVAIIIGGIFVYYFNFYWIDSALAVAIGLYILKETYEIVKKTIGILMEATPENIDVGKIKKEVEKIQEVENLHHVHIWQIDDKNINFEGHVDLSDNLKLTEVCEIRNKIESVLNKFGITHVTIQMEYDACLDKSIIKKVRK